jgi:hypothetical protein
MDDLEVPGLDLEDESRGEPAGSEDLPTQSESSGNQVVAHLRDGSLVKGFAWNFSPIKPRFHVFPPGPDAGDGPVEVWLKHVKAVFFVRDLAGSPQHQDRSEFGEAERAPGHTLEVTFVDGEVLVGSTLGYDPGRVGFFLFPVDGTSNNARIFIVFDAVKSVRRV